MEGSSDNEIMKMILDSMTKISDKDCKDNGGSVDDQQCGSLPSGFDAWKCGKGDVKTTMTQEANDVSLSADIRIISRGCAPTNSQEERYTTGCHAAEEFKDQITGSLGQPGTPTLGKLSGDFCMCEGDNCNGAAGSFPFLLLVLTPVLLACIV